MLAFIAQNDLPYGEVAAAQWTMADEILAQVWPVDFPAGQTGWQQVTWNDGRPLAGVITTNTMMWRYGTTFSNSNRGRANNVSRVLLCQDYLGQPIQFSRDINLLDRDALQDAIKNNEGCAACHSTLDPLAANFWGFFFDSPDSPLDASFYHPENELFWTFTNETAPAYYGVPTPSLSELGVEIAKDPRLAECATQQVFEGLLARKSEFGDTASLAHHREVFVDSGSKLRALFKSITQSPEYRMDGTDDPLFTTKKLVGVDIYASQLADLTGFSFTDGGVELLRTSGLRTLAGGADGRVATVPSLTPTVPQALVAQRLAEGAAGFVVQGDAADPANARLFAGFDFQDTSRGAVVAQLVKLHLRLFSERISADDPEVLAEADLFEALLALDPDPLVAWQGTLSALLRDPKFLFY
jgi:hypothetical protein